MKKRILLLFVFAVHVLTAQEYFPTDSGVKTTKNSTYAFKNATIYVTPTTIIKNGTLLIKEGKVASIGKSVKIPSGAIITDIKGKTIYPSFV